MQKKKLLLTLDLYILGPTSAFKSREITAFRTHSGKVTKSRMDPGRHRPLFKVEEKYSGLFHSSFVLSCYVYFYSTLQYLMKIFLKFGIIRNEIIFVCLFRFFPFRGIFGRFLNLSLIFASCWVPAECSVTALQYGGGGSKIIGSFD